METIRGSYGFADVSQFWLTCGFLMFLGFSFIVWMMLLTFLWGFMFAQCRGNSC